MWLETILIIREFSSTRPKKKKKLGKLSKIKGTHNNCTSCRFKTDKYTACNSFWNHLSITSFIFPFIPFVTKTKV